MELSLLLDKEIFMIERNLYSLGKSKSDDVYLTPYKWSATERRLLQVKSKKYKPFRAFELNYSKWATYNIDKFKDITILETFSEGAYGHKKGDYRVSLSGESYLEEAQDVYYENWCGNLDVKKQFKNSKDEYSELEAFLEYEGDFDITEINSDLRFNISSEDYFELERIFRFKTVEKKNAQEEVA